jgi:hypothetical protein
MCSERIEQLSAQTSSSAHRIDKPCRVSRAAVLRDCRSPRCGPAACRVLYVCCASAGPRATRSFSTRQPASTGLALGTCWSAQAAAVGRRACRLAPFSRGFSASECASTAADPSISDVVAQVQSCVAMSNKETGVLSQVGVSSCNAC